MLLIEIEFDTYGVSVCTTYIQIIRQDCSIIWVSNNNIIYDIFKDKKMSITGINIRDSCTFS